MNDLEKSVDRVLEQYKAAALARDVDAFVRLYDPKVRVFDAWGVWEYKGSEAWQRAVEGWFRSDTTNKIKVTFEDVHVQGSPDFAVVSATVTYAAIAAEGQQVRSMQNRLTWAMRTSGHVLRIVHEHTSSPMGFEDQKAILQKEQKTA